jgi:hypothetical protein
MLPKGSGRTYDPEAVTRKVRMLTGAVLVAAVAAGSVAWAFGSTASEKASTVGLSTLSARGQTLTLPPNDVRTKHLRGSGITQLTLLGTLRGRSFYRVGESEHPCYGAGNAGAAWPLGVILCRNAPPYFPSPEMPVLDLSTVGMDRGDAEMHYIRVAGLAADGVASIGIVNHDGAVIERLPVRANVYGADSLPTATGVGLVALDQGGHVLARVPPGP